MTSARRLPRLLLPLLFAASSAAQAQVVIHEIMYHPPSERTDEEFVELHNTGPAAADVSGWRFTRGVTFTLPAGISIPAGGFLVVAADASAFAAKYPAVTPVVAGWTGILSNSSNRLTLEDALGNPVDEVAYADDGDWAMRRKDPVADNGYRGWNWETPADGGGSSLELIHPGLDNASGLSWAASTTPGGTPGAPNSAAAEDIAPLVLDAGHFPLVPTSSDPVQITARILDDHGAAVTASVHYRLDGDPAFSSLPMADEGSHGDTLPGDGIFGATLPVQADGAIIEFYLSAADAAGHTRVWPAPALDENGVPGQEANCLYQVDNTPYAAAMPLYRIVMRAADRTRLATINQTDNHSHAQMNATFVSRTGTGDALRYRVGVRNRGNSSRGTLPQSFRVNFLQQEPWDGVVAINLNTQYTPHQLLGSAMFRKAGVTAAMARAVQLRVNAVNPASSSGAPAYGFYVANEVLDSDYADAHYPRDAGGNIYKCMQVDYGGSDPGADLGDESDNPDPALADPSPYRENYFKQTNISEDDWSDLIGLTQALAKGTSPALDNPVWEPGYTAAVRQTADVVQWMRYFAANAIADNTETSLGNGRGDDYFMYFGKEDRRARLIPYDLDSIFGRSSSSSTSHSLWLMCRNNLLAGSPPTPVNPFIKHPEFAPLYYAELKRMIDGVFAPDSFGALADEVLGGLVAPSVIGAMKTFNAGRTTWIAGQIPLGLSVTTAPAAQNGYPRVTSASASLAGRAHAITTRSVTVNGVAAAWTAWTATWSAPEVPLVPGVNRLLIQSFDAEGVETGRLGYDVWYDDDTVQQVPASIDADTTWSAAEGPWQLSSTVTVAAGATLTIEPGASVYLAGGARLTVAAGGRLLAEGTPTAPIRFLRTPGSGTAWGTLTINGASGSPESRIAHARFDGNGSPAIDVNAGDVVLDHLEFGNTGAQYLSLDGASFVVSNCHFPDATAGFELVHGTQGVKAGGRGIIRGCYFGVTTGYNDSIDFTGGQRPGPILQLIDNVFARSGDDQVDIDGTDCWIAGNIFLHTHKNGPPDSAAAISGGNNGAQVSRATIIGNLFYDHDHVITAKQGNFYTLIHNTIVRQTIRGGGDIDGGVINMRDPIPEPPTTWGAGCLAVGNIIADAEKLIREEGAGATSVTLSNNMLPFEWTGAGAGNIVADPLFVRVPALEETDFRDWRSAQVLREWLALRPGSPARGAGPGGRDLGGVMPLGVHLSGAPVGTTQLDSATLGVGPLFAADLPWVSGFTHYVWRLDGGPWSAETPAATPLALTGLAPGEHLVEVRGRNDAGFDQDDTAYGERAEPAATAAWTVDPDFVPPAPAPLVRISEVLARNGDTLGYGSTFPDLIELHNAGTAAADLAGWGLTDNAVLPNKYTFPPGTVLEPGQYLILHASANAAVPEPKTGFALKAEGDTVTLSRPPAEGGGVADAIAFGAQLTDYSLGRRPGDGEWTLCFPTFGTTNRAAPCGPATALRLNEWLASPGPLFTTDFIEIHNPSTLPVDLGDGYLTENPTDWPDRHRIRPLTFVAPGGYAVFMADGEPQDGPDHLNFRLSASQGEIGLLDPALGLIDSVLYGPQTTGVSGGRSPNGAATVIAFDQPTPGAPNPGIAANPQAIVTNLIPANAQWRYRSSATDFSGVFQDAAFDDSGWSVGGQLLYIESASLGSSVGMVKTTALPGNPSNSNRPFTTTYFRHRFNYSGPLAGVTLRATLMVDDGAVIYLNGREAARVRMGASAVGYGTYANATVDNSTEETITIPSDDLVAGENVIAVEVHQVNGTSSDVVMGLKLDAEVFVGAVAALVVNEVLVDNRTGVNPDGSTAGWVEVYNPSDSDSDLTGMTLSDDFGAPRKWEFPAGTILPGGGHLVIQCDPLVPASATNTGFGLSPDGGRVLLFDAPLIGGGLRDAVAFGHQLADRSVGRSPDGDGAFTLNLPTRGAINQPAALAPATALRLNEWLASSSSDDDWFEIYNTADHPVQLGGHFLTDDLRDKTRHPVLPLTFVGAGADDRWLVFTADGNGSQPGHVNFALKTSGEELGVFTAAGAQIAAIAFGPQVADVSEGGFPDGAATIVAMPPTPGAANQLFNPDSDSDGMPDTWETANGFDPHFAGDAGLDADGDGQSNLAEFLAGTEPRNPASRFAATLGRDDAGRPLVRFPAVAGRSYSILWSDALDGTWSKLTDVAPQPADAVIEVADPDPAKPPRRFYRLVTPAQQ